MNTTDEGPNLPGRRLASSEKDRRCRSRDVAAMVPNVEVVATSSGPLWSGLVYFLVSELALGPLTYLAAVAAMVRGVG